jgi:tRNA dimethylallyltransferase
VGKSEVAVRVAERVGGEVVGCDALQVYRGLDVATAKPTPVQRARAPHHLVDVVGPGERFSLGEWVRSAERAIEGIARRRRVPVVAGGTGLYLRGLLRGIVSAPAPDPALRERLRRMASRFGAPRLHRWLDRLDPDSARRLAPTDRQRVTRALEACLGGARWSDGLRAEGTWGGRVERYPALKIGLDLDSKVLGPRLDARVTGFFEGGLVDEVRALLAAGIPAQAQALKAIGYREVVEALERGEDAEATSEAVRRSTRRYAKRQRTWFRSEPGVRWLDAAQGAEALTEAVVAAWRED